ncbi:bifunctional sugar-1-phosphate nucleotidylyltransferase/acetyltransferase [Haloarchaeobius sp. HRN-SO-5]|uniref:bifunctional sugar-1-phosphate nucleotidylyltransferase/acetyltransferase n=1 Tax=Haloarchaeobius sp. HRN-SO-5 TaxID=3446118 RepID=UPI003EBEC40C
MQTVLLAAGDGTRLDTLADRTPKPLLPVAGEALVVRAARSAVEAGATELYVVVPPDHRRFADRLGRSVDGAPVTYVVQPRPMGTAEALRKAGRHVDGDFAVVCADSIYDTASLARIFERVPSVGVVPDEAGRQDRAGRPAAVGDGGALNVDAIEAAPPEERVHTGACSFPAEAGDWLDVPVSDRGERELADVLTQVGRTQDVATVEHETYVDVDRPWDLLRATELVLAEQAGHEDGPLVEGDVADGARLRGPVRVAPGATVRAGVVVEGPVVVDGGATVGPNAYLEPATYVGPDVHVGHGVSVENSVLLAGTSIGHNVTLAYSVVGEDVTVGAGTTVAHRRHDGGHVAARADGEYVSTGRRRFGVVAGSRASIAVDTTIGAGVTLEPGTRTEPGERVVGDDRGPAASGP